VLSLFDPEIARSLGSANGRRYADALGVLEHEYTIPDFEANMNANSNFMLTKDSMSRWLLIWGGGSVAQLLRAERPTGRLTGIVDYVSLSLSPLQPLK